MNQQKIKYLINQIRSVYNFQNKAIEPLLDQIRQLCDVKQKGDCQNLIATGFCSVLLEIIFKMNFIEEDNRLNAFTFYRHLLQFEFQNKDPQLRNDDHLESYRLIKLLPQQLYELFLDDEDELSIFNNLCREWNTPNLVWTNSMMKEMLLIYIEYNNQILKKPLVDYTQIFPISSPLFPEIRNETFVQNMMLKEYNLQPSWQTDEGIVNFLNELIDSINQSLKLYLDGNFEDTLQSKRQFERLSCKLLTQLTSFELALEQFFYNSKHPEFQQELKLLEDQDETEINQLLIQQRDTIPVTIVKDILKWMELICVDHIEVNQYLKSCLLQIFNILTKSEVAVVILDELDIINKSLNIAIKILKGDQHKYDKLLSLITISDILQFPFMTVKLEQRHFNLIYQLYKLVLVDDQLINAYKNIIALIYKDNSVSIDFNKYFIDQNISIQSTGLNILQNKDFNKIQIWRTKFDETADQIPNYEDLEKNTKELPIFPIISKISLDPLPHKSEILTNRLNMINQYYEEYSLQIQTGKIIEINMSLNSQYEPQTEQITLRQSINVKEQNDEIEIGDDEIFS